ncbi:MAG TPA: hypothetical protein VNE40_00630 [Candidatus Dormibacteraeota bacterium]|nr:hypothetical protein [Candidatus Dormibacteraeota bacterium]
MSLTTTDLKAIKEIVDEKIEAAMSQTADGFSEVHTKIDAVQSDLSYVKQTVERIELIQGAEIDRSDGHGRDIAKLKLKVGLV